MEKQMLENFPEANESKIIKPNGSTIYQLINNDFAFRFMDEKAPTE